MERWEWLIDERIGIWQDPALGCFSEDSIALAHFLRMRADDTVLDIGAGNGVLCLYAQGLYGGRFTGIDTNESQIALAQRSAQRNGQPIRFLGMRAEDAPDRFGHGVFSRVIMNPPYFTQGDAGRRAEARHADANLLSDWCRAAFLVLNNGGTLTLCYPADRLAALFRALDQNRLASKRMELLLTGQRARLVLAEAKKLGADGLAVTVRQTKRTPPPQAERIGVQV